jgi:hypothetical protein
MGHPATLAARRAERRRVIARRLNWARNASIGFDPERDAPRPGDPPDLAGWPFAPRLAKSKAICTCSFCKGWLDPVGRWRWNGLLDEGLLAIPHKQQGMRDHLR